MLVLLIEFMVGFAISVAINLILFAKNLELKKKINQIEKDKKDDMV